MIPPKGKYINRYYTPIWVVYACIPKPKTEHENKKSERYIDKEELTQVVTLRHIPYEEHAHNEGQNVSNKNNG